MSTNVDESGFQSLLEATFTFNTSPENRPGGKYDVVPEYPITFYDRHLDCGLALKQVQVAPSMARLFSDVCDAQISALRTGGASYWLPGDTPRYMRGPTFSTSWDVAAAYKDNLGDFCLLFPSKFFIYPHYRNLFPVFEIGIEQTSAHRSTFLTEAYFSVGPPFYSRYNPDHVLKGETRVSPEKVAELKELGNHSPQLAIYEFFPMNMSGEKVIKKMGNIPHFNWDFSHTKGRQKAAHFSPHFVDDQIQGNFGDKLTNQKPPTSRLKAQKLNIKRRTAPTSKGQKSEQVVPSFPWRPTRTDRPYRVNPAHFLQHAWARAVVNDATFIIFNCGKYERIGFRHRASQTLFLSELIDTVNCQDPTYGKLHAGLHLALVQDAINRKQLRLRSPSALKKAGSATTESGQEKRSCEAVPEVKITRSPKRQRVMASQDESVMIDMDPSDSKAVSAELSGRNLALVYLSYGVHQSAFPSSFIRREPSCTPGFHQRSLVKPNQKAIYLPHQYFSLTLSEPIDKGATGTVHRASAEIQLESGTVMKYPLIIKLVFLDREKRPEDLLEGKEETEEDRLYNEYAIYQHLASAGIVEGILPMYGLFEDIDSGALALIMGDGGTSLKRRQFQSSKGVQATGAITQAERDILIKAMKTIHESGLRHRDIRAENIVLDSKGGAFIIDFDRAKFVTFPSESLDHELLRMQHVVDGISDDESSCSF